MGDCFDQPPDGNIQEVAGVPCDEPHDTEVYAKFDMEGGDDAPYPGDAAVQRCADDGTWATQPCPAATPRCKDGQCGCVAVRGEACRCGGQVQCDGSCNVPVCGGACTDGRCCPGDPRCPALASDRRPDLNAYVLRAIEQLAQRYGGLGYLAGTAFTHDLDYAQPAQIKAGPKPPGTMCVAAVSEVVITALALYASEANDRSVFTRLPAESWQRGRPTDIRAYMFVYDDVDSNGSADAFTHFGIGDHRPFEALLPGDFIGLNRTNRSGHAVVFLGYLDAAGAPIATYDAARVVGFKYFSAQGSGAGSGLGYRWAFFEGKCPSAPIAGKPRDCGIVRSADQRYLNTGYLWHPSQWTAEVAKRSLTVRLEERHTFRLLSRALARPATALDVQRLAPAERARLATGVRVELARDLPDVTRVRFDGKTTDG